MKRKYGKSKAILISMLLITSVFFIIASYPVSAAAEVDIYFSPSSYNVKNGTSISATIYVDPDRPYDSLSITEITYSTAVLDYTGYSWGTIQDDWNDDSRMNPAENTQGIISGTAIYSMASCGADDPGSCENEMDTGDLITFNFDVVGLGTGYVNISQSTSETDVQNKTADGTIQYLTWETTNCTVHSRYGDQPTISSISPSNETTDLEPSMSSVSCSISDGDGDSMSWSIEASTGDSDSGSRTNGSISCPLSTPLTFGETITWWVNVSDGYYNTNEYYWFTVRDQHTVTAPTGFTATAFDKNRIDLSWSQGENATRTYIAAKQDSYPTDRSDGTNIYNGTGTSYQHSGLDPSEDWYYRAWTWDNVDGLWSSSYAQDTDSTPANGAITISTPSPGNNTGNMQLQDPQFDLEIDLDDPEDAIASWTIETSPDIGSSSGSGEGTKTCSITPLPGSTYTWYVNATDDEGVTSRAWYTFSTTQAPYIVGSPTVTNGSTLDAGETATWWNISVADPEGDSFDVDIEASNGDANYTDDLGNRTCAVYIDGLSYGTTYTVWVNVTQAGYVYQSEWYQFSTQSDLDPRAHHPNPANGTSGLSTGSLTWNCTLEDYEDTDQIGQWNIDCSNGQSNSGVDFSYGPTNVSISLTGLTDGTYTIWVNTTTGTWRPAGWFTFTVGGGPNDAPTIGTPTPTNTSSGEDLIVDWYVSISDGESDDIDWTIEVSDGSSSSGTGVGGSANASIALTGLDYATTYTVYVNATDTAGSGNTTAEWFTFDTKSNVAPTIGTPSPTNGSINQSNSLQFTVPLSDTYSGGTEDDTLNWTIECPGVDSDSGTDDSYGTKGLQLSGLSPDTWYTVYVNVTDGSLWTREWFTFHVANNTPPTVESPFPANGATDITINLNDLNVYINDTDADNINYVIEGDFISTGSGTGVGDGQRTTSVSATPLSFNTTYTWYVNATDPSGSGMWTNETFNFTTETFDAPTGFTATTVDRTTINVTWTQADHAEITYVYRKIGSYPTNRSDGTLVYDGSLYGFTDTGLDMNTSYYYRGWSYDSGSDIYSDQSAEDMATTDANNRPQIDVRPNSTDADVTTVLGGFVEYNDTDGDTITINIYAGTDWANRTLLDTITGISGNDTFISPQLPYNSTIYLWINITDGYEWNNESHSFTTGSEVSSGSINLYYSNATKTGYNFMGLLNETLDTDELEAVIIAHNVTDEYEYFVQWDPIEQEYGDAYYIGYPGAIDLDFEAGDVILISVTTNTTINTAGYAPTMEWEDIPLYVGYNWIGRTNTTTSAYELAQELNTDGANWTQLLTWNATAQMWGTSYLPAYVSGGAGSPWNFNVEVADAVLVSTARADSFNMYGW